MAQHSPTVLIHDDGTDKQMYVAYYRCDGSEGLDQIVRVVKRDMCATDWQRVLTAPPGSGNPVLVAHEDKLYLHYSRFREGVKRKDPVGLKWCKVDLVRTDMTTNKHRIDDLVTFTCGRSQSVISFEEGYILPAYREGSYRSCVVYYDKKGAVESYDILPAMLIQPSMAMYRGNIYLVARSFGIHNPEPFNIYRAPGRKQSKTFTYTTGYRHRNASHAMATWGEMLVIVADVSCERSAFTIMYTDEDIENVTPDMCDRAVVYDDPEFTHISYPNILSVEDGFYLIYTAYHTSHVMDSVTVLTKWCFKSGNLEMISREVIDDEKIKQ